jgi:hypothetical protein
MLHTSGVPGLRLDAAYGIIPVPEAFDPVALFVQPPASETVRIIIRIAVLESQLFIFIHDIFKPHEEVIEPPAELKA